MTPGAAADLPADVPEGGCADVVHDVLAGAGGDAAAPAIVRGRRVLTHGRLRRQVAVLSARLTAEGLQPGDSVLFSVRPGPDAVVLALAVVAAGGVVVVADPGAGPAVFAARVDLVAPRWTAAESALYTISGPGWWQRPLRALARRAGLLLPDYAALPVRHLRAGPWLPGLPAGTGSLRAWSRSTPGAGSTPDPALPSSAPFPSSASFPSSAPALVVFTSGTTGEPRAVVHSRRSLGHALRAAGGAFPMGPGDRAVTDQLMIGLAAVAGGATWVVPRIGAHPRDLARQLHRHRATHAFTTPVTWDGVLRQCGAAGLPRTLRYVLSGGAPVPAPLLVRLADAAPAARVLAVYGATELLPAAAVEAREKAAFDGPGDLVGRPLPGVEVTVDGDTHEVLLRAPQRCEGYLGRDGVQPLDQLRTGDSGRLDEGRIVLEGRLKEMMIRGSTNIYPGLYEPGVLAVPGVHDCALVGLPHPVTGDERIVLALVLDPADAAALDRVRAALPQAFDAAALPDDLVVVTRLPRSGRAAKLDRPAVVAQVSPLLPGRPGRSGWAPR